MQAIVYQYFLHFPTTHPIFQFINDIAFINMLWKYMVY